MGLPVWFALLLPWLVPEVSVELAGPSGRTEWVEGLAGGLPATLRVTGPGPGYLLCELEALDAELDLDLAVGRGESARVSASHRGRERLLVRLEAEAPLSLSVTGPAAEGEGAFRLGLTWLQPAPPARPGELLEGRLDPAAERVLLVRLEAEEPERCRLRLAASDGLADLDLLVCDQELEPVELGEGPGDEVCLHELSPQAPSWLIVRLSSRESADFHLEIERSGKGVKSPAALPLDAFLADLARTDDQRRAVAALRRNPDFLAIRAYLQGFPGGCPLRLHVVPGLRARGVERFGTYTRGTLTINPTIAGHRENVQELLDTLIHELVHALLDLPPGPRFPLAPDVLDAPHDPRLRDLPLPPGALLLGQVPEPWGSYLDDHYGPSASNPERDYGDINDGAQRLLVKVIRDNLRRTGLGRETLVFGNVRARQDRSAARTR